MSEVSENESEEEEIEGIEEDTEEVTDTKEVTDTEELIDTEELMDTEEEKLLNSRD